MGVIRRRELLTGGLLAGAATMLAGAHGKGLADEPATKRGQVTIQPIDPAAEERRLEAAREKAFAEFPFERVETTGRLALAKWRELKAAGRGSPVVLGDDLAAWGVMEAIIPSAPHRLHRRPAAEILAAAAALRHPESLAARHAELLARLMEDFAPLPGSKGDGTPPKAKPPAPEADDDDMPSGPPLGKWPSRVEPAPGLSVARDLLTGVPHAKVHIALIPTDDWTAIPAHLSWGGWNSCPEPEYHVAALRSWRERFGAELVGLSHDTMNLTVASRPATREAALALAREHYDYCSDIVDQGTGTLSKLAASLATHDWWYFWWD
jgi:hypothetical protein